MITCDNEEETKALAKFRKSVDDLNEDDETLLRFLRARDGDLRKAGDMLRKHLEWKKVNDVEFYLTWTPPKLIKDDMVLEFCPNRDKHGYPIVYLPAGRWDIIRSLREHYDECFLTRYYLFENGINHVKQSGKDKLILILDVGGLNYRKATHSDTLQLAIRSLRDVEANYPERLECCYVINLHWVFTYLYTVVAKPFLSKPTLNKLRIFDTNVEKWMNALLERIPESSLPLDIQEIYKNMKK